MMWDIGGQAISNTMSHRNRSRSPHPPHMRMPSPSVQMSHSEANATVGSYFTSYPPVTASTSYNSYSYPSIPHAASATFPSPQIVHVVHHSKHHSSSKNKHHHHKHSGHGHSHSQPFIPPSSTAFPMTPTTSFPMQTPQIHFPTIPRHPTIQPSTSNGVINSSNDYRQLPSPGYTQYIPSVQQTKKHAPRTPQPPPVRPRFTSLPTEPSNPYFQCSKCTGRRRALCIGINYRGQENELRGCINDAKHVRDFLISKNYKSSEIMILTDDTNNPRKLPTRKNILAAMQWLVHDAKPHDSLFFHYSGHGGQTRDLDGDEADGWDEVIYPLDFRKNGHIVDDLMHKIMVRPLPPGCRLTALFDACHSGSVLDLRYVYSSHGRLKRSPITRRALARRATAGDVISWSSCQDGETSADTFAGGVAVGAMSHAFIEALKPKPVQTYQELFRSIRMILNPRYSQKPQLGSSHQIDTNTQFIF